MTIFGRISDIISANLNDLVEKYEDPEKMLRQAVREMETAIAKVKPDVARAMANQKTIAKELAHNEAEVENWSNRAAQAVEAVDDDLARRALKRKQEYDKLVAALADQHAAATEASQVLRRQMEAMQAKLKDAQRRLGTLTARKKAAEIRAKAAQSQNPVSVEFERNAFDKFERLAKKVEMAEAEAEAMAELSRQGCEDMEGQESIADDRDLSVEAELKGLKRKMGGRREEQE